MINLISDFLKTLTPEQRKKYFYLQVLVVFTAVFEVFGVALIGPFIALVNNQEMIHNNNILKIIYELFLAKNNFDFLIKFGVFVLLTLFIGTLLSIVSIWRLSSFAAKIGANYGDLLYGFYIRKEYSFHVHNNSSELVKKISTEVSRVTDNILQPIVQINARIITVFLISLAVFIYKPVMSFVFFIILVISYFFMFYFVRKKLSSNGKKISECSTKRYALMAEGFSSIKEIIIFNRAKYFTEQFAKTGDIFSKAYGSSNTLYNAPRYIVEFVVYSGMVLLVLYLISSNPAGLLESLPAISVLGVAMFKMLPSFQQIYSGLAQVKGNISAFESILDDICLAREEKLVQENKELDNLDILKGDLVLSNVFFRYENKESFTLKNINIHIRQGMVVGVVGYSGAGKSTLLDILLGVLSPTHGEFKVNSTVIKQDQLRSWQNNIGYVPQVITLVDGSILDNIVLGLPADKVDIKKVDKSIKHAGMEEWVEQLPLGIDTLVGEKGMQISGGQRQRVAIARALYNDASYLFFDEATSALDSETEKNIIESVVAKNREKTIIMAAHRLSTLKFCDYIYVLNSGGIESSGTYSYLLKNDNLFKKLSGNFAGE